MLFLSIKREINAPASHLVPRPAKKWRAAQNPLKKLATFAPSASIA